MDGCYDLHLHIGPEIIPRKQDAIEAGADLWRDQMAGAVLKNHFYATSPFVCMARRRGFDNVWGSLTMNRYTGGIDPFVLRGAAALKYDGEQLLKIVWMPTIHAKSHLRTQQEHGGLYDIPPEWTGGVCYGTAIKDIEPIDILSTDMKDKLTEVLRIIAGEGLILATGHLSREEVFYLVPLAKSLGVEKIILTHPLYETTRLSSDDMLSLIEMGGIYAEQSYALMPIDKLTPKQIADTISKVGAEHTIMTTDLGQAARISSYEGMQLFCKLMNEQGISEQDIMTMAVTNPCRLIKG